MGRNSKIEWTEDTWNPITGCSKVSQGCKNCYAEREWPRYAHLPAYKGRAFTEIACHPERLVQPLHWTKPRKVFVNSMSDLFHEDVPFGFIDKVFAVMALANRHTFQVLTKRPARMLEYLAFSSGSIGAAVRWLKEAMLLDGSINSMPSVLPNVWLGVSVEDQAAADERIPLLLQTPAAVRWVSAEPLLGAVDLRHLNDGKEVNEIDSLKPWSWEQEIDNWRGTSETWEEDFSDYYGGLEVTDVEGPCHNKIDWVVVGGESGPKARPMHPDWVRSLRDQCAETGVPFLFKQWGEFVTGQQSGHGLNYCYDNARIGGWVELDGAYSIGEEAVPVSTMTSEHVFKLGKKAAGRQLDGVLHDGYPE